MKLLTAQEMRNLEAQAHVGGLGYSQMMRNAAKAVVQAIIADAGLPEPTTEADRRVLILVGPGNNGGDGLAAAARLHDLGYEVTVYIWRRSRSEDWPLDQVSARPIAVIYAQDDPDLATLRILSEQTAIIVDALLGTGSQGPLRGGLPQILAVVGGTVAGRRGRSSAPSMFRRVPSVPTFTHTSDMNLHPVIVAVDLPTGVDSDTGAADPATLLADVTVSFAHAKRGHLSFPGSRYVGKLLVADMGIPEELSSPYPVDVAESLLLAAELPARPADGHKGTFGKVMVVGGSTNYVGAPGLAAEAAYRVGAGLVTLAVAGAIYPMLANTCRESTFVMLPHEMGALGVEAVPLLRENLPHYDAMLLGPGLGSDPHTFDMVRMLLSGQSRPKPSLGFRSIINTELAPCALPPTVIDADGLNALAGQSRWWDLLPVKCVLTPHPGEMARLLDVPTASLRVNRIETAILAATRWQCTVVFKGAYTVIANALGNASVIPFANPLLATAGTGDVLAGTIAGFLGQGLEPYQAACLGAYLHAWSAEQKRRKLGDRGLLASDLLPMLPQAIKHMREAQ